MLNLSHALRVSRSMSVAFVGAGGKTSAMFQTAREMAPALVTTSTHLGQWQSELADRHLIWPENSPIPDMENQIDSGITLITGLLDSESRRYHSLNPLQLQELRLLAQEHALPFLIEADGSRQKPLKAPGSNEPAIPEFADLVVVVAGLSGLNQVLSDDLVYRSEVFGSLCGLKVGENITPLALAQVLLHPQGGLKHIPAQARRVVLLNQAGTIDLQSQANEMGEMLKQVFEAVVVSTLKPAPGQVISVKENIAGIILAGGASTRFGHPKQLLDYQGRTFVKAVSETALRAGLSPVIVVSGANAEDISASVEDLALSVVYNPEWKAGQSTSIQAGLRGLTQAVGGAVFLLADQPQVSVELLRALVERHSQDLPAVLAPYVFDQRANPLLFDRVTFPELMTISGDTGGRAIFSKFSPRYLNWYDRRLLLDVDTPEDYQILLESEANP